MFAAVFFVVVCAGFAATPGFVLVEGGTFQMGRCPGGRNVTPVRQVTVSCFYMGRFPVTQGEWYDAMGTRPGFFRLPGNAWRNLPVEQVRWFDAVEFANELSRQAGLTQAYTITGTGNDRTVTWNLNANGYRLPTEAEWEFAARGGTVCHGNFRYSGSNVAGEVAWHLANSGQRTHPVGKLRPNALGLYDMSGNVWEWVWDGYPGNNPMGAALGVARVVRGGGWLHSAWFMRPVHRFSYSPSFRDFYLGFRLVRSK